MMDGFLRGKDILKRGSLCAISPPEPEKKKSHNQAKRVGLRTDHALHKQHIQTATHAQKPARQIYHKLSLSLNQKYEKFSFKITHYFYNLKISVCTASASGSYLN